MPDSPSTNNYTLGKGVVYFNQKNITTGVYAGERDLGNAPEFTFNVSLEELEHFSSRGGLKAQDKLIISQITPTVAFTLDEISKENLALLAMGDIEEVLQPAGGAVDEVITANLGMRSELAYRSLTYWLLPYDTGTTTFVEGEVVTGAGGAAGVVLAVTGDALTGTLTIARTNATDFVDDEAITGDIAGDATVNSTTGGTAGTGTPIVFVQDATGTTTYIAGTDYEISTSLKDDVIGRIKILSGGTIVEGESLHVTYGYAETTYHTLKAYQQTQVEGTLRFVSDNPAGDNRELSIWRCSLTPSGDTAMIGDDWSTLGFAGKILKDETGHPDSPYMTFILP
jgi:hypothetical protein